MTVDRETESPREAFAARLTELWHVAGNPTLDQVAKAADGRMRAARAARAAGRTSGLSAQRISDWRAGRNVPSRFESFEPVLVSLIRRAEARSVSIPAGLSNRSAWKRLWKAAIEEPSAAPLRPVVTTALRRDIDTFVGRESELNRLLAAAGPGRVVSIHTIDGMPGIGKTALATRAAHLLSDRFPDGRFFVELHGYTPGQTPPTPFDILATLLTDLGIAPGHIPDSLAARRDLWRDRLANRRALLVLDDARDHAQVEPLLPAGSGCLTLITSRRRLVALDGALPLTLDALDPDNAIELFYLLAHREPQGDDATVAEIVRLCGYLPLAVVLLAGRLAHHPAWTVQTIADQFIAATDRLTELDSGDRAVYASFTMSYRDLSPERARLFRYLGLHPGPDIDTAAVAALADLPSAVARRELEALYTDHLIEEPAPGRYRLHDLLRDYARTLAEADPAEENNRALDRLMDYYQDNAAAADRYLVRSIRPGPHSDAPARDFGDDVRAIAWMRTERANLLACLHHALTDRRVIELTAALAGLLDRDGPLLQARQLHRRAAVIARRIGDRLGEANALTDLANASQRTGDYSEAADVYQQTLTLYREIGDRLGTANAIGNLGLVYVDTGEHARAADLLEQALVLHQEIDNRRGEASTLNALGHVRSRAGNAAEAMSLYRRSLTVYRETGNRLGEANAFNNLANRLADTGNFAEAIELYQQALALYRQLGNRYGEANTLMNIGDTRGETGDYVEAIELGQQALALHREVGNRIGEAGTLTNLGSARQRIGDLDEALELQRQALALFREIGVPRGEAVALNSIGQVLFENGQPSEALEVFAEALELARRIHSGLEQAHALEGAARCRASLGDGEIAMTQLREAVEIYRSLDAPEADSAASYLATLVGG